MLSYTVPAVTLAEAQEYFALSGEAWTGDTGALMRGQRFVATTYNGRWLVEFENDAAPEAVKHAIFEAARREAATPGSLAPDYQAPRLVKRKKIADLETEYADPVAVGSPATVLDGLLIGIARPASGRTRTAMVVRA